MLQSPLQPRPFTLGRGKDVSVTEPVVSVVEVASDTEDNSKAQQRQRQPDDVDLAISRLDLNATHMKSSPYDDPVNHLNLQELELPYRLFALALTQFNNIRPDYATAPYVESFNLPFVFSVLRRLCERHGIHWQRTEFYLVIFRSQLHRTADRVRLGELDKNSHEEACASGGLLTYWFGSPDADMRNLATCIWRNRADAAAGGKGPEHRKARMSAREMYESISFHTHKLVVEEGAMSWHLEDYRD
ncbi:hypothetical protein BDY17DRAFT_296000 [Neohortaea acidophila]|uniref:Uncharacterized protein n=1 Tax=Neohortaea acidophila TaxID=245834 RepID=A0A6A6PX54_9PEZI|nr:uncharacterized protein BDY17DRAFT_296000 [Neohortaea acidophila]KAF2484612.1 hypothetical protein BDY17DRAFT_296000 [Neohortaea acidophila]